MVPCVGVTRCGSRAVGSGLQWRVVVSVCLWGCLLCAPASWSRSRCSLGVSRCRLGVEGWGEVGPSGVVYPASFRPHVLPLLCLCGPCLVMLPVLAARRWFLAAALWSFFCNTSPKPQLQCSQEASPIYIESPTSPSQGSAGWQAGVTAAVGRCKVVNSATKWTSQKWSPHTPCPGAVADNLGVLSGRVPVLSGYPIIRGKQRYIGPETWGTGGGGGGLAVGDQGAVGRPQGKEEDGIPLAWCRGGGRCTMGGPTCQQLAKK